MSQKIRKFTRFSLVWYSQQFAIPFWIVGHVHLQLTSYHDVLETCASILMHLAVGVGFYIDWREYNESR